MNANHCKTISEKLVDYADGESGAKEAADVEAHLIKCEVCRQKLEALKRSLELSEVIWQDGEDELGKIQTPVLARHRKQLWRRLAVGAAVLVMALGGSLIWWSIAGPGEKVQEEISIAEIKLVVERAGEAAQLLAVADLLARQPGGLEYARQRYIYIADFYSDMEAGTQAKQRLQSLSERSVL